MLLVANTSRFILLFNVNHPAVILFEKSAPAELFRRRRLFEAVILLTRESRICIILLSLIREGLFRFENDIVGSRMHKLKLKCSGETLIKGVGGLETAGVRLAGVEFGGGTEFFHTY